jgi:hypothetical protein
MQEGPWIPTLRNIAKEYNDMLLRTTYVKKKPIISHIPNTYECGLAAEQKMYVRSIVATYANSSDAAMKIAAYRTEPMRYIIKQENSGRNMLRVPVLYKDSSAIDMDKKS